MGVIGSGLDINGIVSSLVQIERKNRVVPQQVKQVGLNAKLSLYGQIKSQFSKLETSAADVIKSFAKYQAAYQTADKKTITNNGDGTTTVYTPGNGEAEFVTNKKTTNSNPGAVQLIGTPNYGSYRVNVLNQAERQQYRVSTGSTNVNDSFGGGTLDITFGDGRTASLNFAQQLSATDPDSDPSVQDVINTINSSNVGLLASFDSATGELVIQSANAGASNSFSFAVRNEVNQQASGADPTFGPNDGDNSNNVGFSRIANGIITNTAKDTTVTVDDGSGPLTYTTSGSKITAPGIEFSVIGLGVADIIVADQQEPNPAYVAPKTETRATQSGDPEPGKTKVLTGPSTAELTRAIDTFVSEYNATISRLKKSQEKGDDLDRDTTPFRIESRLRDIFNQVVGGTETKGNIGFSISKEGVLSVDKDKLSETFLNEPEKFKRIFSDAIGKDFEKYAKEVNANGGALKSKTDSLKRMLDASVAKVTSEEDRISRIEKSYRNQFIALDKVLSSLQASQSGLSQALANLQTK